jgi:uncharacterized membrane protein
MSQFPQPPGSGPSGGYLKPHRGTMILVFGILGFVICFIFGIVAWVMGNNDLRQMQAGTMDPSGEGLTRAGKIVGMIAIILNIVVLGLILLMTCGVIAVGAATGASGLPR